ncbi:hypothetical protein ACFVU2_21230 [Leifsonia sp. NPDC058194]|uniref:hypothetical protein n=1 Tax=Leifsonia sp. NPDC058194 TaxID=3346374 RepID=UPI0036DEB935
MIELTTCFECDETVPADEWPDHTCPDPDHDPAEPWMDRDVWDEDDHEQEDHE